MRVHRKRVLTLFFSFSRFFFPIKIQWVTTLLASIVLWGFAIAALVEPEKVLAETKMWQSWVTQNFTWLYIG